MLIQTVIKMKNLFFIVVLFLAPFFGCKKNELGGKSTIKGNIKHHAKIIANATVFIKFNATELPGTDTTLYDAKVRADATGNYIIKCYKGKYFLYGYGYDNQVTTNNGRVTGGSPVSVRNNENITIDLAITE